MIFGFIDEHRTFWSVEERCQGHFRCLVAAATASLASREPAGDRE